MSEIGKARTEVVLNGITVTLPLEAYGVVLGAWRDDRANRDNPAVVDGVLEVFGTWGETQAFLVEDIQLITRLDPSAAAEEEAEAALNSGKEPWQR